MPLNPAPHAVLLIGPGCPHCPALLTQFGELVKQGELAAVQIINLALQPQAAQHYQTRSVPWFRIGELDFSGAYSPQEVLYWVQTARLADGTRRYLIAQLAEGRLQLVKHKVLQHPDWLTLLLSILADLDAPLQARIGVTACYESLQGQPILQTSIDELIKLSQHDDHRIRSDACYCLGFTAQAAARSALQICRADPHPEVREIANEALQHWPA